MSNARLEGFDYDNNYHLTEKEEKKENWEQAKIWVLLGLLMALCLGLTIYMNTKELILKYNGNSVVAEYKNGDKSVTVQDDKGTSYFIDLANATISKQDGNLTVYYWGNNIASAKALTSISFWLIMYASWIPLFVLCTYFIFRNLKQGKNLKQN